MRRSGHSCLVLYNVPKDAAHAPPGTFWVESDVGVLEEVETVVGGLTRLGIRHRVAGVKGLAEVPSVLAEGAEGIVINLVESFQGVPDQANFVPAVCQAHGRAVTGGDTPCLILTTDKGQTRAVLQSAGLPCPQGATVRVGQGIRRSQLPPGPYIVKPAYSDGSEGIDPDSIVQRFGAALRKAVRRVHAGFGQPAVIERFVGHRELNVSVLQRGNRIDVLPLVEIDFSAFDHSRPRIVDYAAKWLPDTFEYQNTPRIIPARLPARTAERVRRLTLEAWHVVGCRDYARVDFRMDPSGRVFILEVNANPDIGPEGGLVSALLAAGITYEEFLQTLLENAAARLGDAEPKTPRRFFSLGRPSRCGGGRSDRKRLRHRGLRIRSSVPADREVVLGMLARTGFFRPDELEVAREVLDDALATGPGGSYQSLVAADRTGRARGWVCFGPTPCTLGTFDVYWIAVDPTWQSRGLGTALMGRAERQIARRGGRMVVIETSGQPRYTSTRQFYMKLGYQYAARIADFYGPGDDKIIYMKSLHSSEVCPGTGS